MHRSGLSLGQEFHRISPDHQCRRISEARLPSATASMIGMLGYKSQIGLLVPIALAAAGLWRIFGAACLTMIGLSLTATLAFGPAVWPAWISILPSPKAYRPLSPLCGEHRVGLFSAGSWTTRYRRSAGWNLPGDTSCICI